MNDQLRLALEQKAKDHGLEGKLTPEARSAYVHRTDEYADRLLRQAALNSANNESILAAHVESATIAVTNNPLAGRTRMGVLMAHSWDLAINVGSMVFGTGLPILVDNMTSTAPASNEKWLAACVLLCGGGVLAVGGTAWRINKG